MDIEEAHREKIRLTNNALYIARKQGIEVPDYLLRLGVRLAIDGYLTDDCGEFSMDTERMKGMNIYVDVIARELGSEKVEDYFETTWLLAQEAKEEGSRVWKERMGGK